MYEKILSLVLSTYFIPMSEACSELCQTTKKERFAKIVNDFQTSTFFEKNSILDIWQGSEYASKCFFFLMLSAVNELK